MKTKKVTFGRSFENFTKNQFDFLSEIKGGAIPTVGGGVLVPDDDDYIPTGGGGNHCPNGMVWSHALGRCVFRKARREPRRYDF